ncbi:MAG: tetratricopeptide repeat protein [Verrucomicrobia bacterium]|nr:tetratricopeptide repeat protein [Verrucomicrobiota bacterium]
MMDKDQNPKHDPKHQELEQHEVKQVLDFLKHYGSMIGIGVLAATVAILASRELSRRQADKMTQAETLLVSAQSPQQLEEVVDRYKSTPAAPVALLGLARTYFNEGDFFQARAQYERFLKKYKNHDLRPIAEFGLASCTAADGDFNGAAEQFADFIQAQGDHYLQPLATLEMARALEQAGRPEEARIALEDFLTESPDSQWAGQAAGALEQLDK